MTAVDAVWDRSRLPSLGAAAALHLGLFAAVMWLGRPPLTLSSGAAVPITLVAEAPRNDARAAVAAPQPQQASTPAPVEKAPTPEPAPAKAPPPAPAPAKAVAKPRPTPKVETLAPQAKPTLAKSHAPSPAFNLDALEASIAKAAHPARPSFARQGAAHAETATQARVATGQGVSQSDMQGLQQLLSQTDTVASQLAGPAPGFAQANFDETPIPAPPVQKKPTNEGTYYADEPLNDNQ